MSFSSSARVASSLNEIRNLLQNSVVHVAPEGHFVSEKKLLDQPGNILITTEPKRIPRLSTGDIVKALRERSQQGPLICESKAAADCIEALLQYPELADKISIFITVNGYIQGAPFAEGTPDPLELSEVSKAEKLPLFMALRFLADWVSDSIRGFDFFHSFLNKWYRWRRCTSQKMKTKS